MATEEEWQRWFGDYERFILHYAGLAAAAKVELFCVGVELAGSSLTREADWRRVVERVRERYQGPLVYAANWWEEYDRIPFWDALDYIGVNAFSPSARLPIPRSSNCGDPPAPWPLISLCSTSTRESRSSLPKSGTRA